MELAPLHWQQLPVILGVLAAVSGTLYALLSLILPRRQVWAPRAGQGLDSEAMPVLVPPQAAGDRRRRHGNQLAPR